MSAAVISQHHGSSQETMGDDPDHLSARDVQQFEAQKREVLGLFRRNRIPKERVWDLGNFISTLDRYIVLPSSGSALIGEDEDDEQLEIAKGFLEENEKNFDFHDKAALLEASTSIYGSKIDYTHDRANQIIDEIKKLRSRGSKDSGEEGASSSTTGGSIRRIRDSIDPNLGFLTNDIDRVFSYDPIFERSTREVEKKEHIQKLLTFNTTITEDLTNVLCDDGQSDPYGLFDLDVQELSPREIQQLSPDERQLYEKLRSDHDAKTRHFKERSRQMLSTVELKELIPLEGCLGEKYQQLKTASEAQWAQQQQESAEAPFPPVFLLPYELCPNLLAMIADVNDKAIQFQDELLQHKIKLQLQNTSALAGASASAIRKMTTSTAVSSPHRGKGGPRRGISDEDRLLESIRQNMINSQTLLDSDLVYPRSTIHTDATADEESTTKGRKAQPKKKSKTSSEGSPTSSSSSSSTKPSLLSVTDLVFENTASPPQSIRGTHDYLLPILQSFLDDIRQARSSGDQDIDRGIGQDFDHAGDTPGVDSSQPHQSPHRATTIFNSQYLTHLSSQSSSLSFNSSSAPGTSVAGGSSSHNQFNLAYLTGAISRDEDLLLTKDTPIDMNSFNSNLSSQFDTSLNGEMGGFDEYYIADDDALQHSMAHHDAPSPSIPLTVEMTEADGFDDYTHDDQMDYGMVDETVSDSIAPPEVLTSTTDSDTLIDASYGYVTDDEMRATPPSTSLFSSSTFSLSHIIKTSLRHQQQQSSALPRASHKHRKYQQLLLQKHDENDVGHDDQAPNLTKPPSALSPSTLGKIRSGSSQASAQSSVAAAATTKGKRIAKPKSEASSLAITDLFPDTEDDDDKLMGQLLSALISQKSLNAVAPDLPAATREIISPRATTAKKKTTRKKAQNPLLDADGNELEPIHTQRHKYIANYRSTNDIVTAAYKKLISSSTGVFGMVKPFQKASTLVLSRSIQYDAISQINNELLSFFSLPQRFVTPLLPDQQCTSVTRRFGVRNLLNSTIIRRKVVNAKRVRQQGEEIHRRRSSILPHTSSSTSSPQMNGDTHELGRTDTIVSYDGHDDTGMGLSQSFDMPDHTTSSFETDDTFDFSSQLVDDDPIFQAISSQSHVGDSQADGPVNIYANNEVYMKELEKLQDHIRNIDDVREQQWLSDFRSGHGAFGDEDEETLLIQNAFPSSESSITAETNDDHLHTIAHSTIPKYIPMTKLKSTVFSKVTRGRTKRVFITNLRKEFAMKRAQQQNLSRTSPSETELPTLPKDALVFEHQLKEANQVDLLYDPQHNTEKRQQVLGGQQGECLLNNFKDLVTELQYDRNDFTTESVSTYFLSVLMVANEKQLELRPKYVPETFVSGKNRSVFDRGYDFCDFTIFTPVSAVTERSSALSMKDTLGNRVKSSQSSQSLNSNNNDNDSTVLDVIDDDYEDISHTIQKLTKATAKGTKKPTTVTDTPMKSKRQPKKGQKQSQRRVKDEDFNDHPTTTDDEYRYGGHGNDDDDDDDGDGDYGNARRAMRSPGMTSMRPNVRRKLSIQPQYFSSDSDDDDDGGDESVIVQTRTPRSTRQQRTQRTKRLKSSRIADDDSSDDYDDDDTDEFD